MAVRETLVKNLRAMKTPTMLLKFGANGRPKFKTFQLSEDNQYLLWDSKSKTAEQTRGGASSIDLVDLIAQVSLATKWIPHNIFSMFGWILMLLFFFSPPPLPLAHCLPTLVKLTEIREIRFGQRTEKFYKSNRKDLQHLSFSIIYGLSYLLPSPSLPFLSLPQQ